MDRRYLGGGPPEKEDAGCRRHLPNIKASSNEWHLSRTVACAQRSDDELAWLARHLADRHCLRASVAVVIAAELRAQAGGVR